ncbi:stress response small protein YobI [Escherichia coli]
MFYYAFFTEYVILKYLLPK